MMTRFCAKTFDNFSYTTNIFANFFFGRPSFNHYITRAKDVQNFDKKLLSKDFVTFFLYFRLKSDQKNQKHRKKIRKHSSYHWVEKIISNTLIDHSSSVVGCFKKRHLTVTKSLIHLFLLMQSGINVMLINEK